MSTTYAVCVTREEGLWVAVVDGVSGAATESRRLNQLDFLVRDLLGGLLDLDPDSVRLDWRYEGLSPQTRALIEQVGALRQAASAAQDEYARTARLTAQQLLGEDHVSLRDAAALMGLSHQRVQQLVAG